MEWNTTQFTNIDTEVFIGRFDGEEYSVQPGEIRYFPSFLSEHFFKHLTEKLFKDASRKEKDLRLSEFQEKIRKEILGKEMVTKSVENPKTIKERVSGHESKIKEMLLNEERQKKAQEIEAIKIIENQ